MKTIKLECFAQNTEICQVVSELKTLQIDNPLDRTFGLRLINLGQNSCDLSLQLSSQANQELWQKLPLTLSSREKLIFRGAADDLLEKEQKLETLEALQELELSFDFDLLPLLTTEETIDLDFSLLIDFSCQPLVAESQLVKDQTPKNAAASAVLAANHQVANTAQALTTNYAWIFYLLSGLFVFAFFVIIKFVHGKKKK